MDRDLIDRLVATDQKIPDRIEILALRQHTIDDVERRLRRLLSITGESFGKGLDRADWRRERDRTVIHLPHGGRGAVFHASGAMKIWMGLAPMEHLYDRAPDLDALVEEIKVFEERLRLSQWAGPDDRIEFERLWQIKARGATPEGKFADPILCRAVGAYRRFAREIPVWGAASASIKIGGGQTLDAIDIQIRETTGEAFAEAAVLPPDRAARNVVAQLRALMGTSKVDLGEVARPTPLRFGYISLGRRKAQRVLAPVYLTTIDLEAEEKQGYVFVVSATEEPFLRVAPAGSDAPIAVAHRSPEAVRV
jgi:hypothetical protein